MLQIDDQQRNAIQGRKRNKEQKAQTGVRKNNSGCVLKSGITWRKIRGQLINLTAMIHPHLFKL